MDHKTEYNSGRPAGSTHLNHWRIAILATIAVLVVLFLILVTSVISLRWINPPVTAFTLQENWDEIGAERYSLREWWIPYDELPHHLKWAVIASEDQHFREHWGFDLESIRDVLEERDNNERSRGASTISQQVAKNLYLWPGYSYLRKGMEAGITILIELFWPKERILEMYLNIAEFGSGTFGAGKASDAFFNIPVSQLEPDMSARMAAVLPSPKRMSVEPPSPYTLERSRWILQQMTHLTGVAYVTPQITDPELITDPEQNTDPLPFEFDVELDLDLDSYSMFNDSDSLRFLGTETGTSDHSSDTDLLHDLDPDSLFDLDLELDTSGRMNDMDTLFSN